MVSEWNIKFPAPDEFTELSYKIADNELFFFGNFKLIYNPMLWDVPATIIRENTPLVTVVRYQQNNDPLADCKASCPKSMGNHDNYTYYWNWAQGKTLALGEDYAEPEAMYFLMRMVSKAEFI
jgi:hypothetical protein